jgi:putative transposase
MTAGRFGETLSRKSRTPQTTLSRWLKGLNNRAENSHQPTRQRERAMKGFRSTGGAQRFLSACNGISPRFRSHRHLMTASPHRAEMTIRFDIWDQIISAAGRPTTPRHAIRHPHAQQRDSVRRMS